uniref:Bgt-20920 n=1 Tax=Blumeria graminis f. sp. tritici 96224 TaxID=1268274 RepID=A0A381LFW8_BLUGR
MTTIFLRYLFSGHPSTLQSNYIWRSISSRFHRFNDHDELLIVEMKMDCLRTSNLSQVTSCNFLCHDFI